MTNPDGTSLNSVGSSLCMDDVQRVFYRITALDTCIIAPANETIVSNLDG